MGPTPKPSAPSSSFSTEVPPPLPFFCHPHPHTHTHTHATHPSAQSAHPSHILFCVPPPPAPSAPHWHNASKGRGCRLLHTPFMSKAEEVPLDTQMHAGVRSAAHTDIFRHFSYYCWCCFFKELFLFVRFQYCFAVCEACIVYSDSSEVISWYDLCPSFFVSIF